MDKELPYLPTEIKRHIISFVDDIDIRRHFGVYNRIPRDDWRFCVLLKRPLIRQTHGKYHPTNGANGLPYGEVIIPQHVRFQRWRAHTQPIAPLGEVVEYDPVPPKGGDLHITVLLRHGRVIWEDYTDHRFKGVKLRSRFFFD
jgi:hypothetical protein